MTKVVQIFVYSAKDPAACEAAREQLLPVWAEVPGFIGWTRLRRPDYQKGAETALFADYMEWENAEACEKGNNLFRHDERAAPFRDGITDLVTGHEYVQL
jgi:hypothetical protein